MPAPGQADALRMIQVDRQAQPGLDHKFPVQKEVMSVHTGIYRKIVRDPDLRLREHMHFARGILITGKISQLFALYAQDEISLSPDLTAYVGGRYDRWTTDGDIFIITTGGVWRGVRE